VAPRDFAGTDAARSVAGLVLRRGIDATFAGPPYTKLGVPTLWKAAVPPPPRFTDDDDAAAVPPLARRFSEGSVATGAPPDGDVLRLGLRLRFSGTSALAGRRCCRGAAA
jgi:hypothetical protein